MDNVNFKGNVKVISIAEGYTSEHYDLKITSSDVII